MSRFTQMFTLLLLMSTALYCWAYKEVGNVSRPLAPMPGLDKLPAGSVLHELRDGKRAVTVTIIERTEDMITVETSDGCTTTKPLYSGFALTVPSVKYKNCGPAQQNSGEQTVKLKKGKIWPLEVGNKWEFSVRGFSGGRQIGFSRSCKVQKTVRVSTAAGEFDTFKIKCRAKRSHRTYYVSPDNGRVVAGNRNNFTFEWMKTELPQ